MRRYRDLVPPVEGSPLALRMLSLEAGSEHEVGDADADALLFVAAGSGELGLDGRTHALSAGGAALVLAGETGSLRAPGALECVCANVGVDADRHAPLGAREIVVAPGDETEQATGARSFRVLFGPHNGSNRATLFVGFVPPGKAPWHYHLYDEIVWIPDGPGRLHLGESVTELGPGSAFRLRPRQVHVVENAGAAEMTVVGVFTPAGSPSAAYLTPDTAAEYRFVG